MAINEKDLDWKEICFGIIAGVGEAEGVYFTDDWKLEPEVAEYVLGEFIKYRTAKSMDDLLTELDVIP